MPIIPLSNLQRPKATAITRPAFYILSRVPWSKKSQIRQTSNLKILVQLKSGKSQIPNSSATQIRRNSNSANLKSQIRQISNPKNLKSGLNYEPAFIFSHGISSSPIPEKISFRQVLWKSSRHCLTSRTKTKKVLSHYQNDCI